MSVASEILSEPSLKAYYQMQEASGLIQDSSGLAHHASSVVDGGLVYNQSAGQPIVSDPANVFIGFVASSFSIPDHADLDWGDTMTAEAWIATSQLGISRAISGRGSGALTWGLDGATNKLFVARADVAVICLSTITIALSTWYHAAYTKSGATNRFYINGNDVTGTVTDSTMISVGVPLIVGADYNGTIAWNGALDHVAFYSAALSQARIQAHYAAAFAPQVLAVTDPMMRTKFGPF